MTIKQMEYYISVIESGSITKAAELQFVAQPALSQQLKAMEKELGGPLLIRSNKGIKATVFGQTMYAAFKKILLIYHQARNELVTANITQYELHIGCMGADDRILLPKIVQSFREKYPESLFSVGVGNLTILEEQLEKGSIDIALCCMSEGFQNMLFNHTRIMKMENSFQNVIVYKGHPLYSRESITIHELDKESVIYYLLGEHAKAIKKLDSIFESHKSMPRAVYYARDFDTLLLMVQVHMGIGFLVGSIPPSTNLPEDLKVVPIADSIQHEELYAFWKTTNRNPGIPAFLNVLDAFAE